MRENSGFFFLWILRGLRAPLPNNSMQTEFLWTSYNAKNIETALSSPFALCAIKMTIHITFFLNKRVALRLL